FIGSGDATAKTDYPLRCLLTHGSTTLYDVYVNVNRAVAAAEDPCSSARRLKRRVLKLAITQSSLSSRLRRFPSRGHHDPLSSLASPRARADRVFYCRRRRGC